MLSARPAMWVLWISTGSDGRPAPLPLRANEDAPMTETARTSNEVRRAIADQRRASAALNTAHLEALAERPEVLLRGTDESLVALDAEIEKLARGLERGEAKAAALEIELTSAKAREALEALEARRERLRVLAELNQVMHGRYEELAGALADLLAEMAAVAAEAGAMNELLPHGQRVDVEYFRRGQPSSFARKSVVEATLLPGRAEDDPSIWPVAASGFGTPRRITTVAVAQAGPIEDQAPVLADRGIRVVVRDDRAWFAEREAAERQERIAASTSRSTARAALGSAVGVVR